MSQRLVRCGVLCPRLEAAVQQPRARLRGWLHPACWWRCPEVGVSFLSFLQQHPAAASSLLGSTGRAPPGEVLEKSPCTSGYVWLLPCSWGWQRGCGTSLGHRVMLGGLAGTLGLTAAQVLVLLWCARDTRWRRDEVRVPSCAPRTSWAAARVCFLLLVQAGLATRSPGVHSALCFSC